MTKTKDNLRSHVESIRKELCCSCNHCDFKAPKKTDLQKHIKTIHFGIGYSYKQCDDIGIDLTNHIKSAHEGI